MVLVLGGAADTIFGGPILRNIADKLKAAEDRVLTSSPQASAPGSTRPPPS